MSKTKEDIKWLRTEVVLAKQEIKRLKEEVEWGNQDYRHLHDKLFALERFLDIKAGVPMKCEYKKVVKRTVRKSG